MRWHVGTPHLCPAAPTRGAGLMRREKTKMKERKSLGILRPLNMFLRVVFVFNTNVWAFRQRFSHCSVCRLTNCACGEFALRCASSFFLFFFMTAFPANSSFFMPFTEFAFQVPEVLEKSGCVFSLALSLISQLTGRVWFLFVMRFHLGAPLTRFVLIAGAILDAVFSCFQTPALCVCLFVCSALVCTDGFDWACSFWAEFDRTSIPVNWR